MRKETFTQAIEKHYASIQESLTKRGIEPDVASDTTQEAVCSILASKSYTHITSEKESAAVAFVKGAVRNCFLSNTRRDFARHAVVTNIEDAETHSEDPFDRTDFRDKAKAPDECPFCHREVARTAYKDLACPHCHTVVGAGSVYTEVVGVTDEELLADLPDLDTVLDVNKAMLSLTEIERTIVEAFIMRNVSLDDMSLIYDIDRFSLRRMFLRAKDKLKVALAAYDECKTGVK